MSRKAKSSFSSARLRSQHEKHARKGGDGRRLVRGEQQMPCPGPGLAPGPNSLLGFTYTLCSSDVSNTTLRGDKRLLWDWHN
jgi:hypothetical protein